MSVELEELRDRAAAVVEEMASTEPILGVALNSAGPGELVEVRIGPWSDEPAAGDGTDPRST